MGLFVRGKGWEIGRCLVVGMGVNIVGSGKDFNSMDNLV
jgi:hypothetical protein